MPRRFRRSSLAALLFALTAAPGADTCSSPYGFGLPFFRFEAPFFEQLSLVGDRPFRLRLPRFGDVGTLEVTLDGAPASPGAPSADGRFVNGILPGLGEGVHELRAEILVRLFFVFRFHLQAATRFELVDLENPDGCEILNDVECLLPYPSSRFLEPAATPTGYQVAFPEAAMPRIVAGSPLNIVLGNFSRLDPAPYNEADGFSPTVQVLMHFPAGVDAAASDAPRIQEATRTFDRRSLDRDSPTVLLDADTGERVPHFIENDARAAGTGRQATVLRPLRSLTPGHRYIVAVRDLVDPLGHPVEPEPVFLALRDSRPSDIPALNARRTAFQETFRTLRRAGVRRSELILAFDFVVASDQSLTREMLSMREQGFDFLANTDAATTFTVDEVEVVNPDCADPGIAVWKAVRGTFQVPLFLEEDPILFPGAPTRLVRDADGVPVQTGIVGAPYGLAIPCAVFDDGGTPLPGLVVGHGLFGNGPDMVSGLTEAEDLADFRYIAAGTNWSGLSSLDAPSSIPSELPDDLTEALPLLMPLLQSFIGQLVVNFDLFPAMADRLRQGQLATLVLARMLDQGVFNLHPEFQVPTDAGPVGVIDASATGETYYFGASLGGIMGLMFAALTPDVEKLNVDVPSINFSILLQRATPFLALDTFFDLINDDALSQILGIELLHEHWVRGESAGYATHITSDPLPGTPVKQILMTVALHDQQVTNIGSEIAAATLGLPALEGSVMSDLALLEDQPGPLPSAYVVYDTGAFDLSNPAHLPFVPPLDNRQAEPNRCDPHGRRGFIPASIEQLLGFLSPGGTIENYCADDGICNASEPFEIPFGDAEPCNPL